jgi:hypothetical protein
MFGVIAAGLPTKAITIGLAMELVVTPALALWRERIESMTRSRVRPRSV